MAGDEEHYSSEQSPESHEQPSARGSSRSPTRAASANTETPRSDGQYETWRSEGGRRQQRRGTGDTPVLASRPSAPATMTYGSIVNPDIRDSQQMSSSSAAVTEGVTSERGSSKARKPSVMRKASAGYPGPHRGQEFSVDDDRHEVEKELLQKHAEASSSSSAAGRTGTVRQKPSTIRRRVTAIPSNLSTVEAADEEYQGSEAEEPVRRTVSKDKSAYRGSIDEAFYSSPGEDEAMQTDNPDIDMTEDDGNEAAEEDLEREEGKDDDEDDAASDAESFTLRDKQNAINETHPFGVRIWKPALYKKNRSVEKTAEGDIHSSPGGRVSNTLFFFNFLWSLLFGSWLAAVAASGAILCFTFGFTPGSIAYGRVLWDLAGYIFYPFGKFVKLEQDAAYAEEDEGEGRPFSEYEQWQSGDLEDGRLFFGPLPGRSLVGRRRNSLDSEGETDSLLGRGRSDGSEENGTLKTKKRLFGRGQWNAGRVIFYVFFYLLITPALLLTSGICWLMVFWIPMGRVTVLLFYHLRKHPLALSFHSDGTYSRTPTSPSSSSSILVCTYRAVGLKYWKYTIDGTNVILINLLGIVVFVIFDYWVLAVWLDLKFGLTHPAFIFILSLFSIIPLAYFIGQAVASISAQSSMGVGAAINAFFSTIVEVFLYCVALKEGKGQLVEGSIIGSIFAGILFLPGLSMCFGAIKRKTQRFNVRSAGVTSTMLLFAVIAAFGPTLFYQIYGTHELNCLSCVDTSDNTSRDCRRCYFSQVPAVTDRFFIEAVRPYCWFAAVLLFMSYLIGLWFTLRTHAAVIWETEVDEKKQQQQQHPQQAPHQDPTSQPKYGSVNSQFSGVNGNLKQPANPGRSEDTSTRSSVKDSPLYKRILDQSLDQVVKGKDEQPRNNSSSIPQSPHLVPRKERGFNARRTTETPQQIQIPGLSEDTRQTIAHEVAEVAATAATAARDSHKLARKTSSLSRQPLHSAKSTQPKRSVAGDDFDAPIGAGEALAQAEGGHDAPNWSRLKSAIILLGATLLYAIIAEMLVNTVDVVLESVEIDEKFLGITLFALVPNTTEFLNAISFAMNGNIALSMEIGSAYALQVCLLQIPALVLFSAISGRLIEPDQLIDHTFSLIFPQWDMVTVILCVFLLSYMYGEGKSNYFKGSILILSYLVVVVGFYLSALSGADSIEHSRFDILESTSPRTFKTIGRTRSGPAF